jgi:hypothetical protein
VPGSGALSDHPTLPVDGGLFTRVKHPLVPSPLAYRPSRWTRVGLVAVLAGVAMVYAALLGWQRQLSAQLQQAVISGRIEDCLRLSDQGKALAWLPGARPLEVGPCLRETASRRWRNGEWAAALRLQHQLAESAAGVPDDRQRLAAWRAERRRHGLALFQAGDLAGALAALAPLQEGEAGAESLERPLRQIWERNRQQRQRAERLAQQARWWEALDALNRIDHPWWRGQIAPLRRRVEARLAQQAARDHGPDSHGELPSSVPLDQLDAAVRKRISAGMGEWQAFEQGCRELGGRVVEAGPESACQR